MYDRYLFSVCACSLGSDLLHGELDILVISFLTLLLLLLLDIAALFHNLDDMFSTIECSEEASEDFHLVERLGSAPAKFAQESLFFLLEKFDCLLKFFLLLDCQSAGLLGTETGFVLLDKALDFGTVLCLQLIELKHLLFRDDTNLIIFRLDGVSLAF